MHRRAKGRPRPFRRVNVHPRQMHIPVRPVLTQCGWTPFCPLCTRPCRPTRSMSRCSKPCTPCSRPTPFGSTTRTLVRRWLEARTTESGDTTGGFDPLHTYHSRAMKRLSTLLALIAFTVPCFAQSVPVPKAHEGEPGYWISEHYAARMALALEIPCTDKPDAVPAPATAPPVVVVQPPPACAPAPQPVVAPHPRKTSHRGTSWGKVAVGAIAGFTAGVLVYYLLDDAEPDHHHTVDVNHYLICTEGVLALSGAMMCGGD